MKTKRNALTVNDEHYDRITLLAEQQKTTRSSLLEQWIAEALDRDEALDVAEAVRQRTEARRQARKQQRSVDAAGYADVSFPKPKRKKPVPIKSPTNGANGSGYHEL